MVRKSVLSGVLDEVKIAEREGGLRRPRPLDHTSQVFAISSASRSAADQAEPIAACVKPKEVAAEPNAGKEEVELLHAPHKVMTELHGHGVACDQRVFNMCYTTRQGCASKAGYDKPHHTATHEERTTINSLPPMVSWFTRPRWKLGAVVEGFTKVRKRRHRVENVLIYATSITAMPAPFARRHGDSHRGRRRRQSEERLHVDLNGEPGRRVAYTALRSWHRRSDGAREQHTSKPVGEILFNSPSAYTNNRGTGHDRARFYLTSGIRVLAHLHLLLRCRACGRDAFPSSGREHRKDNVPRDRRRGRDDMAALALGDHSDRCA